MKQNEKELRLIERALRVAEKSVAYGARLESPTSVSSYLALRYMNLPHELFGCIWLTSQHDVIEVKELFNGTLTQTAVYPREVVKAGLFANAAATILFHNHPSGVADPSSADINLTNVLKQALALVDITVLDHIIVSRNGRTSFAERGLI